MDKDIDKRLMKQRAETLAHLYLTEEKNVRLLPPDIEEYPFDYLVRVRDDSRNILAQFGMVAVGLLQNKQGNDKTELKLPNVKERRSFANSDLPVCQFVYFMHGDQGYYRWLREPVSDGTPGLKDNFDPLFHRLNADTRQEIFSLARTWYASTKAVMKSAADNGSCASCGNEPAAEMQKATVPHLDIHLSPEDEDYIKAKVTNRECGSVSEAIAAALHLLREQDKLRRDVQVGVEQLNSGQYATYDAQSLKELFEQIKAEGRKRLMEHAQPEKS